MKSTARILAVTFTAVLTGSCSAFNPVTKTEPVKIAAPEKIFLKRSGSAEVNERIISAWKTYQSGNYKKSSLEFERLIDSGVSHYDVYYGAGISFLKYYNNDKAVRYLTMAIKAEPDHFEAIYLRASIYKEMQDFKAARSDYEQILNMKPSKSLICGSYSSDICTAHDLERRRNESKRIIKML
jgi:tetratricopeptide (TPR) repeat protein